MCVSSGRDGRIRGLPNADVGRETPRRRRRRRIRGFRRDYLSAARVQDFPPPILAARLALVRTVSSPQHASPSPPPPPPASHTLDVATAANSGSGPHRYRGVTTVSAFTYSRSRPRPSRARPSAVFAPRALVTRRRRPSTPPGTRQHRVDDTTADRGPDAPGSREAFAFEVRDERVSAIPLTRLLFSVPHRERVATARRGRSLPAPAPPTPVTVIRVTLLYLSGTIRLENFGNFFSRCLFNDSRAHRLVQNAFKISV